MTHQRRWYDGLPNFSAMARRGALLPARIQHKLAERLHQRVFKAVSRTLSQTKPVSLGVSVVTHLHGSKHRRRWYDQVERMHQAFNRLLRFSTQACEELDRRCLDLVSALPATTSAVLALSPVLADARPGQAGDSRIALNRRFSALRHQRR